LQEEESDFPVARVSDKNQLIDRLDAVLGEPFQGSFFCSADGMWVRLTPIAKLQNVQANFISNSTSSTKMVLAGVPRGTQWAIHSAGRCGWPGSFDLSRLVAITPISLGLIRNT
jgi:hypothetical protein